MRRFLFVFMCLTTAAQAGITRGPYIQMPDTNGVTIMWRVENADYPSLFEYGLEPDCTEGSMTTTNQSVDRVVHLPDLLLATNYYYKVEGELHNFRSRRSPDHSIQFALIGDFGAPTGNATRIAQQVNNVIDLDLLLTVGDNVYPKGAAKDYDSRWFGPYSSTMTRTPCFPVLGETDILDHGGQPLLDAFQIPTNGPPGLVGRNYSFDYGNAHFIAIDSNPFAENQPAIVKKTLDWAAHDLAATKQPWKFAYFHHSAYTSLGTSDESLPVKNQLMPVLEAGGVQMAFTGSNHFYERIKPINGIVEIVTGAGGQTLSPVTKRRPYSDVLVSDRHSFTVVKVDGPNLTLREIDETGQPVDEFSMTLPHAK